MHYDEFDCEYVTSACLTPDGRLITKNQYGTVTECGTGRTLGRVFGRIDWVDGRLMVTQCTNNHIFVDGQELQPTEPPELEYAYHVVSPLGQITALLAWDTVLVWDKALQLVCRQTFDNECVSELSWEPSGMGVLAVLSQGNSELIHMSGARTRYVSGDSQDDTGAWCGNSLAIAGRSNGNIQLWPDISRPDQRVVLKEHKSTVTELAWSSAVLASCAHDATIRLWNLTGVCLIAINVSGPAKFLSWLTSNTLAHVSGIGRISIIKWNPSDGTCDVTCKHVHNIGPLENPARIVASHGRLAVIGNQAHVYHSEWSRATHRSRHNKKLRTAVRALTIAGLAGAARHLL